MRKYVKSVWILLLPFFIHGCDLFEFHPYDGNIKGERGINEKNISRIEQICAGKETIRFAFISDTQGWYNETEDCVNHLNKQDDIDFVIHGGDISDFGMTKEFMWMRDILNKLTVPYVVIIGNHDCLANGTYIFNTIFGNDNFSFLAGNVKFICLNTNALEYDYSKSIPDFSFMENEYNEHREGHEKTVFAMHVPPFGDQFNNNVAYVFHRFVKEFPKLQFCLYGHEHHLNAKALFEDEVMYYSTPNINKRQYLIFTIKPDNEYIYEVVDF